MVTPEPLVLRALQGFTDQCDKWPGPRAVKIFVASQYHEFREERRQILEMVGPELQATYDDRHIEFEFVDMHYGSDGGDECNPTLLRYHLDELRSCNRISKAGYFLCLIGGDTSSYQPVLPYKIPEATFQELLLKESSEADAVKSCYRLDADGFYHLFGDEQWFNDLQEREKQREQLEEVQRCFKSLVMAASSKGVDVADVMKSPVEMYCELALELLANGNHPKGMLAVFRDIPKPESEDKWALMTYTRLCQLKRKIEDAIPDNHIVKLESPSAESSRADPPSECEESLAPFREHIQTVVGALVDDSLSTEPDQGKGRKKTVQEVFLEHITHLRICLEHNNLYKVTDKNIKEVSKSILSNMKSNYENKLKHPPVLVHGPDASGKTTLLNYLYVKCEDLFDKPVLRIIRFSAATPRSAYNLELLRVLCQQISIILNIPEGYLPKDASFDPLYINNWLQSLLKRCEEMENEILLIFIDNVHRVNPLECDIVTGLSWLPMCLPKNVFLVCTSSMPLEQLQLTPSQKEKFKGTVEQSYYLLSSIGESPQNNSHGDFIDAAFDNLETIFGSKAFSKLAGYITCSEFGLTELELLELLMPTSNSEAVISLKEANFNFSTLCAAKFMMDTLLLENVVSGRCTWRWRAAAASARARRRYVRVQSALRDAHSDLAALHFANFLAESDDTDPTSEAQEPGVVNDDDALLDSTPFHSGTRTAAAFTQRHVEESWLHLLLAGDFTKLKDLTVCNFDFLLAAVQTVTISYLRCILEHVRCYILDRDVELVYGAVKKASDILTRDPMQLGAQIIAWLRPAVARRGVLATLVTAAMAWCDGYDKPLLVPLNGWLQPPIASTVRVVSIVGSSGSPRLLQLAPSGQHLVLAPENSDPQLWHIMSNSKVHTFKGHSGKILSMCVTRESQYLLTGSEDTTVIVWDLHTLAIKTKILEHIAPVLCVAAIVNRSLVISGGEDSSIVVASLVDGTLVTKLDHHRGSVTGVKVIQDGEILVTCSQDGTICTWNVENFIHLTTINVAATVHAMEVTEDYVFLITLQGDNELHLRTFITGTYLHQLKRHKTKIKCFCVAHDSSRIAIGGADQRVYIYSMHSGQLLRTLAAAHDLSALAIADKDHFLLVAGSNRVTIYSFHTEDNLTNFRPTKQLKRRQTKSTTNVTLLQAEQSELIPISCLEVSRDGQLAASGCARGLVRVWQLSTHRLQATLSGHMGHVTCVTFSPNNLIVLSGSEDRTVVVWQLADNSATLTYKGHSAALQTLLMMSDSRRAMSSDRSHNVHVWLVDSGIVLHSTTGPSANIAVTLNMKFAVLSDGDNSIRIWGLAGGDSNEDRRTVSHAERITCFALTADSQNVVTGSMDMSLKVWQLDGGKLSQVLVGHSDMVTCVAVSITNKTQVVSGSWDCNLIVWDINTGSDLHLLSGHLGKVTAVKVTGDGTIAVSGAEDKTLIIWETKRGLALTSLALHVPLLGFQITSDCARIVVHLLDRGCLPIICLHNTPATYVKIPTYAAPTKDIDELRPLAPKRPMRRLLKKEVSLDTYTWQKKYGHLTSAAMMAQVDERLKRRFSVSASMEEISKIQEAKNKDLGSQVSLGPEQAALAQSQHFDQLEALWNKISPPRRRSNKSLTKQSSLIETRFDSSDDDHTPVEEQEHMVE